MKTSLGTVHFKCCEHNGQIYEYPEFEDIKKIALQTNLSIREVIKEITQK